MQRKRSKTNEKNMTLLGTILQFIFSVGLTVIPAVLLNQQKMSVTIGFCFMCLFAASKAGGLLLAVPITVILLLFFLWLHFAISTRSPVFLNTTLILVTLWFISQAIQLPIRIHLNQASIKIAANITGLLMTGALTCGTIEFMRYAKKHDSFSPKVSTIHKKKQEKKSIPESFQKTLHRHNRLLAVDEDIHMNVSFKCRSCGSGSMNDFRYVDDFSIPAYDDVVLWSDCTDENPPLNENNWWIRSNLSPKVGESRAVCVSHPFNENVHDTFWTLFLPELSSINGWEDHPDEIDRSAFLHCKIENIITREENHAWLRVTVIESIPLSDAVDTLPEVKESVPIVESAHRFEYFNREILGEWMYYSGGAQGDLGHWMLVKEINGVVKLIAFGELSFHQSCAYLGNIAMSNQTLETLNGWCRNI